MSILVTGGTGYIGSHTVIQLLANGYNVIILDNFSNSKLQVIRRMTTIADKSVKFLEGDIRNRSFVRDVLDNNKIDVVMHFAGLKAVGESESFPLKYYDNNVNGSVVLLEEMQRAGVKKIVFSSSATVYGESSEGSYSELDVLNPVNVYGRTKLMVENILKDIKSADSEWSIAILRYFNPVGAHSSGLIGEDPFGVPNNLMPFITQVAVGKRNKLSIFGNDYDTPDGTGLRDYIHVDDLASGHLAALKKISHSNEFLTINLGRGFAYSVLEVVYAFEKASGKKIPFEFSARRPGDLPAYYANPSLALELLGWKANYDIDRMCQDSWRWQINNPEGYS